MPTAAAVAEMFQRFSRSFWTRKARSADSLKSFSDPAAAGSLKDFKESAERAFLVQKLRENRWNISATAAAVGTPRSNLYKKLEAYGISEEKDG